MACIQISSRSLSLSLSLTLSLGFFLLHILSNPPHPRLSVQVQVGISQSGEQSISFTKIFHQSSKLPSNMKAFFPEITPLFVWRYSTLHSVPLSYPCQPFTLTHNHPIGTAFYMVPDLTLRSTSFQPPTHKGPSENSLLCSTPHVWDQVCEVAGEVDPSSLFKRS